MCVIPWPIVLRDPGAKDRYLSRGKSDYIYLYNKQELCDHNRISYICSAVSPDGPLVNVNLL